MTRYRWLHRLPMLALGVIWIRSLFSRPVCPACKGTGDAGGNVIGCPYCGGER